jgi:hypothetical protein
MGRPQARGRFVQCERSSGNGKERRSSTRHERGPVVSCCWMPSSDEHNPCGMGSAGFIGDVYAEGRVIGRHQESRIVGYGSYPGDNSAGASSNGRGDDADGGESVGLARKLLPVT